MGAEQGFSLKASKKIIPTTTGHKTGTPNGRKAQITLSEMLHAHKASLAITVTIVLPLLWLLSQADIPSSVFFSRSEPNHGSIRGRHMS